MVAGADVCEPCLPGAMAPVGQPGAPASPAPGGRFSLPVSLRRTLRPEEVEFPVRRGPAGAPHAVPGPRGSRLRPGPPLRLPADPLCSVPQHGREEGPSVWKLEQRQGSEEATVRGGGVRLRPEDAGPEGLLCVGSAPPVCTPRSSGWTRPQPSRCFSSLKVSRFGEKARK